MKKEALKAQLMARAEAAIEELLAGRKAENTLSEIENLVEATLLTHWSRSAGLPR